jgi:pimeloyl-ACP methyl ester carboxylesterase
MTRSSLVNLGNGFAARVVPGSGDVTFWIHGYTLDAMCWAGLWDCLPGWTHLSIELPGHGSSLPLDAKEELSALARRIGALAIAHRARNLVAVSLGSAIALQVAIEYPGAFATLVLGGPVLGGGPFNPEMWKRYEGLKTLFKGAGHGPHLRDYWMDSGASLFQGIDRCPRLREQLRRQVAGYSWWELSDDSYVKLWRTPQHFRALRTIGVPTLLLVGADDCLSVKQCAGFLERLLPHCERHDLAGRGHLCLIEDPASVQPFVEQHWLSHRVAAGGRGKVSDDDAASN